MSREELAQAMEDASETSFAITMVSDEILVNIKGNGEKLIQMLASVMGDDEDVKAIIVHAALLYQATSIYTGEDDE
jgi:hypothetical protein